MTQTVTWQEHQQWESEWWGDCLNTFGEETKQITYAHRMGLVNTPIWEKWPLYDLKGKSVLDLGGGPTSMLLKTINGERKTVVDPCSYPAWISERYEAAGIRYVQASAEGFQEEGDYDECWIYNVLQHVKDPVAVLATASDHARLLRIFEWIDLPPCMGHPHELKAGLFDSFLGATGTTEHMNENGCVGRAYYGAFAL